jgi:hypothetical protein
MAKIKSTGVVEKIERKISRPGVHAKTKTSNSKTSRNYKKSYKGQGR